VILAIDTTSDSASVALVDVGQAILSPAKWAGNATVIEEVLLESPDGFAHVLFDEIERLLSRHNIAIHQIDAFAVAAGPGSFTGVRVGLTAAKGLAEATRRKVVAVSNLQALASLGNGTLRAVVIDARRGDIYGAVYDAALNPVGGELVIKYDDWLRTLPAGDLEFITKGFPITGVGNARVTQAPRALAGAIGKIAVPRFEAGLAQDPSTVDANYVRRSDAEVFWKDTGVPLVPRE
jgi:tRNA threonylcarbamoyladenosine biosynthesis protein TsaB